MRVLITGGAGFIGSHLAEHLLAQGHDVSVIDNFVTGSREHLPEHQSLTLREGDIADAAFVEGCFREITPNKVVHAAASYKDPDDWVGDVRTNVLGTANVVKAAMAVGVDRLIYFQTALCYGNVPQELPVTLSHPRRPDCSYAISKTGGEQYIEMSGLDYATFRLANIIGPRNLSGPVAAFYNRLADGKDCFVFRTRRDFVFVDDLVEIVTKALAGVGRSGTYHCATGSDYAIKEIYDIVAGLLNVNKSVEVREPGPDDAPTILLDPTKTTTEFGWRPTTPLTTAIEKAVSWYRKHGVAQAYTHLKIEKVT